MAVSFCWKVINSVGKQIATSEVSPLLVVDEAIILWDRFSRRLLSSAWPIILFADLVGVLALPRAARVGGVFLLPVGCGENGSFVSIDHRCAARFGMPSFHNRCSSGMRPLRLDAIRPSTDHSVTPSVPCREVLRLDGVSQTSFFFMFDSVRCTRRFNLI